MSQSETSYHLEIRDVMGVEHLSAELLAGRPNWVTGRNASGKTTVVTALQAVTTHQFNPLGLPVSLARSAYQRDESTGRAQATLDTSDDFVRWVPRAQSVTAEGVPLSIPEAVGLVDFVCRGGEKAKTEALQRVLLPPLDTILDLVRVRLRSVVPDRDLERVVDTIVERGWDAAHGVYVERGREAKRQWDQITGTKYGVRKAADWRPRGWLADWDHLTVQQAEDGVSDARAQLSALHTEQAISEADARNAEAAREQIPDAEQQMDKLQRKARDLDSEWEKQRENMVAAVKARRAVERDQNLVSSRIATLQAGKLTACPHCDRGLVVLDGRLRRKSDLTEIIADLTDEHEKIGQRLGPAKDLEAAATDAREALRPARNNAWHKRNEQAATMAGLRQMAARQGTVITDQHRADLAKAEQQVDDAKQVLSAVVRCRQATRLAETAVRYEQISKALGPQGIRANLQHEGIGRLNAGLQRISDVTGWDLVSVTAGGRVALDDRPIGLCSESERWRAQASIQLTLAALASARIVVIDRADLLDTHNWKSLHTALATVIGATDITVVAAATDNNDLTIFA